MWGEWRYSSTILDLDNTWRWIVRFTPRQVYPRGKSPHGTHRVDPRAGLDAVENREASCLCRESNPGRAARRTEINEDARRQLPECSLRWVSGVARRRHIAGFASFSSFPRRVRPRISFLILRNGFSLADRDWISGHELRTLQFLLTTQHLIGEPGSAVGIATGYGLDDQGVGVRVPVEARIFTSPCRSDRLWGPLSLLSNEYRGFTSRG
jgi:hypothetical protein